MNSNDKPVQAWEAPKLVALGQLKDVAGNKTVDSDGASGGFTKAPAS